MSWQLILAFFVLLLPVPLGFLIPANPRARPDPRLVRRARYAAVLFPLFVAAIQLATMVYMASLYSDSQATYVHSPSGLFTWAPMAWFFFAHLVYVLRKPATKPFSETNGRAATLIPRHKDSPVPIWAWIPLAGSWACATLLITMTMAPVPTVTWILLASAAFVLIPGPWLVRQNLLAAEPLLPGAQEPIHAAYCHRRRIRSWCLFTIIAISAFWKTLLATLYALDHPILTAGLIFPSTAGLILIVLAVFLIYDHRASQRIKQLLGELVAE